MYWVQKQINPETFLGNPSSQGAALKSEGSNVWGIVPALKEPMIMMMIMIAANIYWDLTRVCLEDLI